MTISLTLGRMDPFAANIGILGLGADRVDIVGGADHKGIFTINPTSTSGIRGVTISGGINIGADGGTGNGGAISFTTCLFDGNLALIAPVIARKAPATVDVAPDCQGIIPGIDIVDV